MRKILAIVLALWLAGMPNMANAANCGEMLETTNWNSIAAGIYGNYIFYRASMNAPNIGYFRQAMRQCLKDLDTSLQGGELDWQDAALTRFKNLVAIALVGLYEMNRCAAVDNYTEPALEIAARLREAYAAMREKDIFKTPETAFMRGFRELEESGIVAATCAKMIASKKFEAGKSAILLEYVKYNDNIQHVIFNSAQGNMSCSWVGNCIRQAGKRIKCNGTLGSAGGFEGEEKNGRLIIRDQSIDGQCGFSAMAGIYEER